MKPSQDYITNPIYIDPLSFKKISEDDRVTVSAPSGTTVDFIVKKITPDSGAILGPNSHKGRMAVKDTLIVSSYAKFRNDFQIKEKDLVTIVTEKGHKTKMLVDLIVGKEFLILSVPGSKSKVSLFEKLKFFWNIGRR